MTLKEKFQNIPSDYLPLSNNQKNECVLIADEFAIGFARWKEANAEQDDDGLYYNESRIHVSRHNPITINRLLEIYKEQKGL